MKVPGAQRSSFHICDILDLNNPSDTKSSQSNHNNNNNSTSNNNNSTNTSFPPQSSPPASRDGDSITNLNDSIASTGSSAGAATLVPPPPPYQLSSAIYSELGHHYQSMFPSATATKSWLKEHEQYGEFPNYFQVEKLQLNWYGKAKEKQQNRKKTFKYLLIITSASIEKYPVVETVQCFKKNQKNK